MTSLDLSRRAATVLLVAALFVTVPSIAIAKFTGAVAPAAQSVSTASLVAPTSVTGTFTCSSTSGQTKTESVSVSVTGFTDAGPAGSTYTYVLSAPGGATTSTTSAAHAATLGLSITDDGVATTWTLKIHSSNHGWTGVDVTKGVACTKQSAEGGSL